eukprot:TRINITY_DN71321_c0_g1_i1.p1 TRINITY_DN71321_c0_g1~~TRINITY_DN71321_c0_g1_i1.p1  ORF type:complete len:225 (+),score=43.64 TRINITY_DN71321_c0_g1_i1:709-1383(+)
MKLSFGNMTIELNLFNACKQMQDDSPDFEEIDMIEAIVQESLVESADSNSLGTFESDLPNFHDIEDDIVQMANSVWNPKNEEIVPSGSKSLPSQVRPSKPELKPLPVDLKYAYLGDDETFLVVISAHLNKDHEVQLMETLKQHKGAIAWTVADIKGNDPYVCTHHIYLEENAKPSRQMQRRLNPTMQEVVRVEVLKLLDVGIIRSRIVSGSALPKSYQRKPASL